jgi:hypothetical protein
LAQQTDVAAQGQVGTIQGVSVFVDPNVPTDVAGTQDLVLVTVKDDIWPWQSPVVAEVLAQPYAADLSVMLRLYAYSGLIVKRLFTAERGSRGRDTNSSLTEETGLGPHDP